MRIHVHSIVRNEEKILPFFLDWYEFADAITIWDDNSDDDTREIAQSSRYKNTVVIPYPQQMLDDGQMAHFYSYMCAECKEVDWIISVDADEFLQPIVRALTKDVDVVEPLGYEMKSPCFPKYPGDCILSQVRTGIPATWWDNGGHKPCIVRGGTPVQFCCGRHNLQNRKQFKIWRTDEIKLLHYRDLGYEYYKWHHERNAARLSPDRKDKSWGKHNFNPMTREQFALSLLDSEWVI